MTVETSESTTYLCDQSIATELRVIFGEIDTAPIPESSYQCQQWEGRRVVVIPKDDRDKTARSTAAMLADAGAIVSVSVVSGAWIANTYTPPAKLTQLLNGERTSTVGHTVLSLNEFLERDVPDCYQLLGPIYEQDIGLLVAWRGTGKTLFCLTVASAIAAGMPVWGWAAGPAKPVLYVDGEMPYSLLRAHLETVLRTLQPTMSEEQRIALKENLRIVTPDVQPDGILPSLATASGRQRIDDVLQDSALAIFDNIACLVGGNAENDPEEWGPVRSYQLALRKRGAANIFVHHAGKGGDQRGHSSKEDICDWSMRLERPQDHDPSAGARFVIKYPKLRRDIPGLKPLDITLRRPLSDRDHPRWEYKPLGEAIDFYVLDYANQGFGLKEIVSMLREDHQIRKSVNTVSQILRSNGVELKRGPK